MNNLAEIIESEFIEAVNVKNKDSLHRLINILINNISERQDTEKKYQELKADIRDLQTSNKLILEQMDKRFEQVDKRFEENQHYMDKRFSSLQWFMGIGFTLLVVLMSIYKFIS